MAPFPSSDTMIWWGWSKRSSRSMGSSWILRPWSVWGETSWTGWRIMSTVTIVTCPLNCRNQNLFFPALIIRMDVTKEKIETVQAEKKVREKRRRKFILLALLVLLLVFIVVGDQVKNPSKIQNLAPCSQAPHPEAKMWGIANWKKTCSILENVSATTSSVEINLHVFRRASCKSRSSLSCRTNNPKKIHNNLYKLDQVYCAWL